MKYSNYETRATMAVGVLKNTRIFNNLNQKQPIVLIVALKRNSTVPQSIDAVLLERDINTNVLITIPQSATFVSDMIGPPHPVSNLRPVVWYRSASETSFQRKLKDFQEATQTWNQRFWVIHNTNFINEKKLYIEKHLPADKQTLTADEMSGFYKEFLDKNWKNHLTYNVQWYKRNLTILFLSIVVNIERLFQR